MPSRPNIYPAPLSPPGLPDHMSGKHAPRFQEPSRILPVPSRRLPVIIPVPRTRILPLLKHHPSHRIRKRRMVSPVQNHRAHVELLLIRITLALPGQDMRHHIQIILRIRKRARSRVPCAKNLVSSFGRPLSGPGAIRHAVHCFPFP